MYLNAGSELSPIELVKRGLRIRPDISKNCACLRVPYIMNRALFVRFHWQPYGFLGDEEPTGYLANWTEDDSIIFRDNQCCSEML